MTIKQFIGRWLIPQLPITRENFDIFRLELNAFIVRFQNKISPIHKARIRKNINAPNPSVNIGAGPFGAPGWINIDLFPHRNISFTFDARKKLPFRNNSVERIRCEHFFEHLDRNEEAPAFLKECLRALKPGKVLRLVVPDLEKFVSAYVSQSTEKWKELGYSFKNMDPESQWQTPIEVLNHTFRQNGEHKFGYDFQTLEMDLKNAGFERILKNDWNQCMDTGMNDDLENHRPYSLYVDAVKPSS